MVRSYFICFDFQKTFNSQYVFWRHSQPSFCSAGLSLTLCSFGCYIFCRLFGFREFNSGDPAGRRKVSRAPYLGEFGNPSI